MISDINTFTFVANSLGNVFDFLISLADGHHVEHICIRDFSGFQVVNVTTNAHIDCVFDAVCATDDDLMRETLRHYGLVEDVPE
jgi:hypothetical protein